MAECSGTVWSVNCRPASPRRETPKPLDPTECPQVPGYDDQSATAGVAGDQRVVAADALAPTFQTHADFGGMGRSSVIECQHL